MIVLKCPNASKTGRQAYTYNRSGSYGYPQTADQRGWGRGVKKALHGRVADGHDFANKSEVIDVSPML